MIEITCPACGEHEDLRGERRDGEVAVVCGACGASFVRDLTPRCTACGSEDLVPVPTNLLEDAGRGEQRAPTGIVDRLLCWECGATDATASDATAAQGDWRARRADLGLDRHRRSSWD